MIEGVAIRDLVVREDERGWLTEMLSVNLGDADLCHIYLAMCRPGVAKAFHAHLKQADRFVCVEGTAKIGMVDLRGPIFSAMAKGMTAASMNDWLYLGAGGTYGSWRDYLQYCVSSDYSLREPERDQWWMAQVEESTTFLAHQTVILSAERPRLLTIPRGVAHGQTALGGRRSVILNAPTKPYNHSAPDELRIPCDAFGFKWEVESK